MKNKCFVMVLALLIMLILLPTTVMAKGFMESFNEFEAERTQERAQSQSSPAQSTPAQSTPAQSTPGQAGQPVISPSDYSGTYLIANEFGYVWDAARVPFSGVPVTATSSDVSGINQYAYVGDKHQQFRFEKQSDGTYKIYVVSTGKLISYALLSGRPNFLAIEEWNDIEKNPVTFPRVVGEWNVLGVYQRWRLESAGNNMVRFVSNCTYMNGQYAIEGADYKWCESLARPYVTSGKIQGYPFTLVPVSRAAGLIPLQNGVYKINPPVNTSARITETLPGTFFTTQGNGTANGTNAIRQLSPWGNGTDWRFERQSNGTYTITHVASGRLLTPNGNLKLDGTRLPGEGTSNRLYEAVQIRDRNNQANQRWWVIHQGNGLFRIVNSDVVEEVNPVLQVQDNTTGQITTYKFDNIGGQARQFRLVKNTDMPAEPKPLAAGPAGSREITVEIHNPQTKNWGQPQGTFQVRINGGAPQAIGVAYQSVTEFLKYRHPKFVVEVPEQQAIFFTTYAMTVPTPAKIKLYAMPGDRVDVIWVGGEYAREGQAFVYYSNAPAANINDKNNVLGSVPAGQGLKNASKTVASFMVPK